MLCVFKAKEWDNFGLLTIDSALIYSIVDVLLGALPDNAGNHNGGVIRFERHLAFDVHAVWDAITAPARLADWWLPFEADDQTSTPEGSK